MKFNTYSLKLPSVTNNPYCFTVSSYVPTMVTREREKKMAFLDLIKTSRGKFVAFAFRLLSNTGQPLL